MECLDEGWDGTVVSNVGEASDVTPEPTPDVTPEPTAVDSTPEPTRESIPSPTYGGADGCLNVLNVDIGYTLYSGTWDAIDGGYGGKEAYSINNNGYQRYLYYKSITWSAGGITLKWIMSYSLGSYHVVFFCTEEDVLDCSGQWSYISGSSSDGSYVMLTSSTIDTDCVNAGETDMSCASYDCLYVTGTDDYDGYYSASTECNDDH